MKLAILGGGGVRMPAFVRAVLADDLATFEEISLFEPDALRRQTTGRLAADIAAYDGHAGVVTVTADLEEACTGSNFVFSAMRVGGDRGRVIDEEVALERGLVGQETVGPGGCAMALRTIPVVLGYCDVLKRCAPTAVLINFTNPAGIITQAVSSHSAIRCVGVCDTPSSLIERLTHFLGARAGSCTYSYSGLNHLGWVSSFCVDGEERIDDLLTRYEELQRFDRHFAAFDAEQVRSVKALPSEYVFYYYDPKRYLDALGRAVLTRGQDVLRWNDEIVTALGRAFANGDVEAAWNAYAQVMGVRQAQYMTTDLGQVQQEGGRAPVEPPWPGARIGGYEAVALDVIDGLTSELPREVIVNTANGTSLSFLEPDDIVEVPALISDDQVVPRAVTGLSRSTRALITEVKEYERMVVEAAVGADAGLAGLALALHPLVPGLSSARELIAAYREAHGENLAYLR